MMAHARPNGTRLRDAMAGAVLLALMGIAGFAARIVVATQQDNVRRIVQLERQTDVTNTRLEAMLELLHKIEADNAEFRKACARRR